MNAPHGCIGVGNFGHQVKHQRFHCGKSPVPGTVLCPRCAARISISDTPAGRAAYRRRRAKEKATLAAIEAAKAQQLCDLANSPLASHNPQYGRRPLGLSAKMRTICEWNGVKRRVEIEAAQRAGGRR